MVDIYDIKEEVEDDYEWIDVEEHVTDKLLISNDTSESDGSKSEGTWVIMTKNSRDNFILAYKEDGTSGEILNREIVKEEWGDTIDKVTDKIEDMFERGKPTGPGHRR
jgi:hypothetical protein